MGRTYEEVVEAGAKALYEHQRARLYQHVEQRSFDPEEMVNFFLDLRQETDRAIAIIAFSYIESCLSDLLEFELTGDIPGGIKSLLDPDRPLGTVNAKIRLCAGLNWISPQTASDLDLMRKIRNRFAHTHKAIDFNDPKIRGYMSSMTSGETNLLEIIEQDVGLDHTASLSLRETFHIRAILVCEAMVSQMLLAPAAIKLNMHPGAGFTGEFDELPQIVRDLRHGASRAVCILLGVVDAED